MYHHELYASVTTIQTTVSLLINLLSMNWQVVEWILFGIFYHNLSRVERQPVLRSIARYRFGERLISALMLDSDLFFA